MKSKYSVFDICSWIIIRSDNARNQGGDELSLLKLMKLLYYAEGCSLASNNGSLFSDDFLAWEHGPVIKAVWDKYRGDTSRDIQPVADDYKNIEKISADDIEVLEGVYQAFGIYSAWGLRNKTHEESPWLETTHNGTVMNGVIDRGLIKKYFEENYVA